MIEYAGAWPVMTDIDPGTHTMDPSAVEVAMRPAPGSMVCITGGAGFIGSELARQLVAQGAFVRVVDNLANGKSQNLDPLSRDQVELCVADVRDDAAMQAALDGVDVVFHLACLGVRHSIHSPRENHDVNASGTLSVLLAARHAGVARFVYISSSEVYGTARTVPMTEDHPTAPTTVYGASKLAGEMYTMAFHRTYAYATTVVRPFNTYGPRSHHESDSGEVIPRFMLRCLAGRPMVVFGDGSQTRDFMHVSDTARGIVLAGRSPEAIGEIVHMGSGREITINELARTVARITGQRAPDVVHEDARPGDTLRLIADNTKARRLLGFEPRVGLEDGLADLMDWYAGLDRRPERLLEEEELLNWEGRG